jgi:hypothetical protein
MSAPLESWKVLPHGASGQVDDRTAHEPRAELRRLAELLL